MTPMDAQTEKTFQSIEQALQYCASGIKAFGMHEMACAMMISIKAYKNMSGDAQAIEYVERLAEKMYAQYGQVANG